MHRKLFVRVLVTMAVLLVAAGGTATTACAQPAPWHWVSDSVHQATVQVWAGYSPRTIALFGRTVGARFVTAGVRYDRPLARSADGTRALDYGAEVVPLAAMTYDPAVGAPASARRRGERTLYGWGLTPLLLRVRGRQRYVQPYLEGGAGFVRFSDPLPDRRGERFNFTFRVGAGVRVRVGPGAGITLGYRFHHLSNGFRGQVNPGFDSNIFHLGVTVARL